MIMFSVFRSSSVSGSFSDMTYGPIWRLPSPEHKRRKRKTSGRLAIGIEDVHRINVIYYGPKLHSRLRLDV